MADISVDFFSASSNFKAFLFQKGKDVLDGELNGIQDLALFERYLQSTVDQTDGVGNQEFYAVGSALANDLTIQPGNITVQGLTYSIAAPTLLSDLIAAAPLPTRSPAQSDYVYVDFQLEEVDAGMEPTIAVSALGETARRRRLSATWGVGNGVLGSPLGAGNLYANGVVRKCIAIVHRRDGVAAVAAYDVMNQVEMTRAVSASMDQNVLLHLTDNAQVQWDVDGSELTIRELWDNTDTTEGLRITYPGGASYVVNGAYSLLDGEALLFRPNRLANLTWPASTTPVRTATGTSYSDPTTPVYTATLDAAAALDDVLVLAIRLGDTVVLRGGQVMRVPSTWTTRLWTVGSWYAPDNRKQKFEISVGNGTDSWGDFNGTNAFGYALALISQMASGYTEIVIRVKDGVHTCSGAVAASYYTHTHTTGTLRLRIVGTGSSSSIVSVDVSTYTVAALQFLAGVGAVVDLSIEGVTFSASSTSNTIPMLYTDVPLLRARDVKFNLCAAQFDRTKGAQTFMDFERVEVVPVTTATAASMLITGIAGGDVTVRATDCVFWTTTTGAGNSVEVIGTTKTRFQGCQFLGIASSDSPYQLRVRSSTTYGVPELVEVLDCIFEKQSLAGAMPALINAGKVVRVRDCHFRSATGGATGWYLGPYVDVDYLLNGASSYTAELVEVCNNHFRVGFVEGASPSAVVRVAIGATNGITTLNHVAVDDNKMVITTDFGTKDFLGVHITKNSGGGNMKYNAGSVCRNKILTSDPATHTGAFTAVRVGNNTAYGAGTNELQNVNVNDNTIVATGAGSAASKQVAGIELQAPARAVTVDGNTIRLRTATFGGGSYSDGVYVKSGIQDATITGNIIEAEYPCDVSAASLYAYVHGNHVVRCANTGSRGGTGANTTFAGADNKLT